ncbi:hypothetical protein D9M72_349700 [compost metagenome]
MDQPRLRIMGSMKTVKAKNSVPQEMVSVRPRIQTSRRGGVAECAGPVRAGLASGSVLAASASELASNVVMAGPAGVVAMGGGAWGQSEIVAIPRALCARGAVGHARYCAVTGAGGPLSSTTLPSGSLT